MGEVKDFEYVISFQALYKANRTAKKCKQQWKEEVIDYQLELAKNLWALHYDLKYEHYLIGPYRYFKIYDPKEREIEAISFRDRIVQHSLCDNYLIPLIQPYLVYENVACQKGKGTALAIKLVRKYLTYCIRHKDAQWYIVYVDISKFFDRIDHVILKEKLLEISKDKKMNKLIWQFIDSFEKTKDKGLPMGNQSSQMFALLYLDDLDKYIKKTMKEKMYVRYMDDILVFVKGKSKAREVFSKCNELIENVKLKSNSKSQIISSKQGITFLGYRFFYGENGKIVQTPKKATRRRILKKIKEKSEETNMASALASYDGYLSKSNAYYFRIRIKKELLK